MKTLNQTKILTLSRLMRSLKRQHILLSHCNKQIVPSFFNIDALLERWKLHFSLFTDEETLPQKLRKQGHIITESPLYHNFTEEQKIFLGIIKQDKEEKLQQDLQAAKQSLMELDTITIPKLRS